MSVLWVIQENLNRDDDELLPIMDQEGIAYTRIKIIPFSDSIPDVEHNGPVIVRGSTTTLRGAEKKAQWKPGVWHNANFKPSVYAENYRELFLNYPGQVAPIGQAAEIAGWNSKSLKFVRPNSDYKELTGRVMTRRDLRKLAAGVAMGQYPFDSSLELFIAEPKTVIDEARFTIVNRHIVSGYFYRINRSLKRRPATPEFWEVAADAVAKWEGPDEVYSLDIGLTKAGRMGVIECNCFNASGIYGDNAAIVKAVTSFVEAKYGKLY
jgi:hypothetical protein